MEIRKDFLQRFMLWPMDNDYSVVRKYSDVELQVKNGALASPEAESFRLISKDEEMGHLKSDSRDDLDDDDSPLGVLEVKPGSGISGAVFNLTTSVIGAGIMALPATMKVLGLLVGVVLILLMGIVSEISVEMLVRFSVHCKAASYGDVVQYSLGRVARILSQICIIVNNAGVLVVYLIIMGDVLSGSLKHIGVFDQLLGHGFWDHRKVLVLVILVVFLAPLCALDKIDSLCLTSAASVALAVVFVVVTFVVASIKLAEGKIESPQMVPDFKSESTLLDLLVVIPIMSNAYVCHFNVQPIYNELEGPSPQKMNHVGRITTVICVLVYASTAISGYLLFGKDTESDILTNFDQDLGIPFSSGINYIVRVGYILHLILVFPVIHFSLRQTVDDMAFEGAPPLQESRKRCLGLTAVLLLLIYFGSTTIPNIWTAFKFTGATTAVSLGFTFPALIALKLNKQGLSLSCGEKFMSWFMLVLACIVSVAGIVGNIFTLNEETD